MSKVFSTNRRAVITGLTATAALSLPALPLPALAKAAPKIVIIGGGFGGASAAMTLRRALPRAAVTLIEPNPTYHACPFSNLVISGERTLDQQAFTYDGLARAGVQMVYTKAQDIDASARLVTVSGGGTIAYDRLIVAPGIDLRYDSVAGYDAAAAQIMPHGWKAGAQTQLLADRLAAMEDGGTVVMSVPRPPYRCPPGPYERASLVAHYLKTRKPKSKLILLDAQDRFSKQPLFEQAWAELYPSLIERIPGAESGRVIRVDATAGTVHTDFDSVKADLANIIPEQQAGEIAQRGGLTDATGWCPIDPVTFASTQAEDIYVIGDATIAAPMPKSAFSAHLQGEICALQILRSLPGEAPLSTTLSNTCYSYIEPDQAVSVSGVYRPDGPRFAPIAGAGGTSPLKADIGLRQSEANQARAWFHAITTDVFG